MGLFNKKKEEKSCCCGSGCTPEKMAQAEAAKQLLGSKFWGLAARSVMHWKMPPKRRSRN